MKLLKNATGIIIVMILALTCLNVAAVSASDSKEAGSVNSPQQLLYADVQNDFDYFDSIGIYHIIDARVVENLRTGGTWEHLMMSCIHTPACMSLHSM